MRSKLLRRFQNHQLLAAFANCDLLAHVDLERGNVDLAAAHRNVSVAHQLAGLAAGHREAKAVDHRIQTALQLLQQNFAGHAFARGGLFEVVAELAFLRKVHALSLLLFAELKTVSDDLRLAVLAVLAGSEIALLHRALFHEALCAFEEQLGSLAAAKAAYCIFITSQLVSPSVCERFTGVGIPSIPLESLSSGDGPKRIGDPSRGPAKRWRLRCCDQTRRFFGGRQPLCGTGVTSLMVRTSMPAAASARIADSRPEPGPETRTSTERRP